MISLLCVWSDDAGYSGHQWSSFFYDNQSEIFANGGIFDAGIEEWDFQGESKGFIQVGGKFKLELKPSLQKIYKLEDLRGTIKEDPGMLLPYPRSGHCFVRLEGPYGKFIYLAIGGETQGGENDHISYCYCTKTDCRWNNSNLPHLKTSIEGHSCAVIKDSTSKDTVIIAGGTLERTVYITYEACMDEQYWCDWTGPAGPKLPESIKNGSMITLNNQPFLFGGHQEYKSPTSTVYKHVVVSPLNSSSWVKVENMKMERRNHLVLSVPEAWLCFGEHPVSTASTTAYTSSTSFYKTSTLTSGKALINQH